MSKVVIVTGASRGIGRAIVEQLFKEDAEVRVVAVARSEEPLRELQRQFSETRFQYVAGDITELSARVVDLAIEKFGRIDSVIANAGVLDPVASFHRANVDEWRKLFDVNFFSIVDLVSKAVPHLIHTNGSAIFVSSGASIKGYNGWGAYGSSKAALNHFAMTIASEEPRIRAIAVAPGVVDTQMQIDIRETFGPQGMTPEALKRFTDLHENKQLVKPEVPGCVYAKLALNGIPEEYNGKYLRYSDKELEAFSL